MTFPGEIYQKMQYQSQRVGDENYCTKISKNELSEPLKLFGKLKKYCYIKT